MELETEATESKKIKVFTIRITYGDWVYEYKMGACAACSAIAKALTVWGDKVRISAQPKEKPQTS